MTTPTTYNSCERVIRDGMRDAGKLQRGQDPSSEDFADGINRLNDIINFEQINGLKIWMNVVLELPLVANKATYTLGPAGDVNMVKPTRCIAAQYNDAQGKSRPLTPTSLEEYQRFSDKATAGSLNSFYVNKQRDLLSVTFWLPPDTQAATGTVDLTLQRQCTTMISLTDSVDFPAEWMLFLRWAMARDLCTGQPKSLRDRCDMMYVTLREELTNWDVEDADTMFQMDTQSRSGGSEFR